MRVFDGLRYVVKTGAPWRWMPNDLPPWEIVGRQARRWLAAGVFESQMRRVSSHFRRSHGVPRVMTTGSWRKLSLVLRLLDAPRNRA